MEIAFTIARVAGKYPGACSAQVGIPNSSTHISVYVCVLCIHMCTCVCDMIRDTTARLGLIVKTHNLDKCSI